MTMRSDLKILREYLKDNQMQTVEQIAEGLKWEHLRAQKAVGKLLSSGFGISHPKRYEVVNYETARAKAERKRLAKFLEKYAQGATHPDSVVRRALKSRDALARAWG